MSVINGFVRETVLQIKRINYHGLSQLESISDPKERTVKVDQHELVRICVERRCVLCLQSKNEEKDRKVRG
jgi:hypothetical protein